MKNKFYFKLAIQTNHGIYIFKKNFENTEMKEFKKFIEENNHELSDDVLTTIREKNLFKRYLLINLLNYMN